MTLQWVSLKEWSHVAITYVCVGGGVDYDSGPYTIKFTSKQIRAPFNISINDDDILEHDESFTLIINDSLPSGVSVEKQQAVVTIVDTDCKYTNGHTSRSMVVCRAAQEVGGLHP